MFEGVRNFRYLGTLINFRYLGTLINFKYLGTLINSKDVISDEIDQGLLQVIDFYSLRQIRRSGAMSRTVKIQIYGTLVGPAVVFGSATGLWLRWI
jgi:hypothetical protein